MGVSSIEWTDYTFNPWIGCSKVHAGCANCYAEADFDHRKGRVKWGPAGTRSKTKTWREPVKWNGWAELDRDILRAITVSPMPLCTEDIARATGLSFKQASDSTERLEARGLIEFNKGNLGGFLPVGRWERPRVFCASLADVFEDWEGPIVDHEGHRLFRCENEPGRHCGITFAPAAMGLTEQNCKVCPKCGGAFSCVTMATLRADLFALIDATPNLDWLLLTKRPENIAAMMVGGDLDHYKLSKLLGSTVRATPHNFRHNVWLGTSVSDQASADKQITELLECRDLSPVLFLSCEPLLGEVDATSYLWSDDDRAKMDVQYLGPFDTAKIDWVIAGGESGPQARPMHPDWVRGLRNQCEAAGVPFFFKQWGEWIPDHQEDAAPEGFEAEVDFVDDSGELYPVFRVGKKLAGRLLDGREWSEFPDVRTAEVEADRGAS